MDANVRLKLIKELLEDISKLPKSEQTLLRAQMMDIFNMYTRDTDNMKNPLVKRFIEFLMDRENEYSITIHPCDYDESYRLLKDIDDEIIRLSGEELCKDTLLK